MYPLNHYRTRGRDIKTLCYYYLIHSNSTAAFRSDPLLAILHTSRISPKGVSTKKRRRLCLKYPACSEHGNSANIGLILHLHHIRSDWNQICVKKFTGQPRCNSHCKTQRGVVPRNDFCITERSYIPTVRSGSKCRVASHEATKVSI